VITPLVGIIVLKIFPKEVAIKFKKATVFKKKNKKAA